MSNQQLREQPATGGEKKEGGGGEATAHAGYRSFSMPPGY